MKSSSTVSVDRSRPRHYFSDTRTGYAFSQVKDVMVPNGYQASEADLARGKDVHVLFQLKVHQKACAIPPAYQGYAASIDDLLKVWEPFPIWTETPSLCYHTYLPYGGTPDFYGTISVNGKTVEVLLEVKTGTPQRWHPLQLMAYHKLELYKEAKRLYLVYVSEEGKPPKLVRVKHNARDWAAFVSALNLLVWRER